MRAERSGGSNGVSLNSGLRGGDVSCLGSFIDDAVVESDSLQERRVNVGTGGSDDLGRINEEGRTSKRET